MITATDGHIQKLMDAGLFGAGLTPVDTPELVSRYNRCLEALGIAPTALTSFTIDGMGWSPEVANEKQALDYLTHGPANELAIILTPEQEGKPVYFPYNSFERRLLQAFFEQYRNQIATVTASSCLWLDFNNGLSIYESPRDLLLIDEIEVRPFDIVGLIVGHHEQQTLITELRQDDQVLDPARRQKLLANAKRFGDLRDQACSISTITFDEFRSYHTRAFGGVFVFRDLTDQPNVMIFEDGAYQERTKVRGTKSILSLADPDLVERLIKLGLVIVDLSPEHLEQRRKFLKVQLIGDANPDIDYDSLSSARKNQLLLQLGEQAKILADLERLKKRVEREGVDPESLKPELRDLLLRPNKSLAADVRAIVWQLIGKINPIDVLSMYAHDKETFFALFRDWTKSRQDWAIKYLQENYRRKMDEA